MTANRNLKRSVRQRAARTGESYTAARQHLAPAVPAAARVAVAQLPLHDDPGDVERLRASGVLIRELMLRARADDVHLVHFPEGALTAPGKRIVSSTGPETVGPADWTRADWAVLEHERDQIARLAAQLRLWVVLGSIHRTSPALRPVNCLYVISSRGRIAGRYDERMLSWTKSSFMYTPGRSPLVFTAHGVRFGCALGMETHYAELFSAYEELDVDCVLFSTHGNADVPGVFAIEAAGHAAANSIWAGYAGPAAEGQPASGLIRPDGEWAARCAPGATGLASADVITEQESRARAWRRTARTVLRT